jgi:glycosyltransferase involved in cell wall biosynthesis
VTVPSRARCVHLLPDTHDAGAENQARYLIGGLADRAELEVEIAFFGAGRAHDAFEALGVPMLHVPRRGRFRTDAVGRARRIRRAYREREPAILHTWMLEGNVIGLLAARAWHGTRVVITQRGSWNELDYAGLVRLQRLLMRRADAAISNSPGGAEMLASLGMARDIVRVIPNGIPANRVRVNRDREAIRADLGWGSDRVVVWVGRVSDPDTVRHKDLRTLLAATARLRATHPSVRLVLVGPSTEDLELAGLAADGLEATGWQPRPAEMIAASDVLALSSRFEGNSNVVGEALLLGTPVVTTDCGGHVQAVRDAGGFVVAVGDSDAFARALDRALDSPPNRAEVAAAAESALSVDRMVDETAAMYREVLNI